MYLSPPESSVESFSYQKIIKKRNMKLQKLENIFQNVKDFGEFFVERIVFI